MNSYNISENNGMWKGDNALRAAIHLWVISRKPKPNFCECCKVKKPKDLANISQKYYRDVNDYEWLCRKCHMVKDGRLERLHTDKQINKKRSESSSGNKNHMWKDGRCFNNKKQYRKEYHKLYYQRNKAKLLKYNKERYKREKNEKY